MSEKTPHSNHHPNHRPFVLIVLDGWGHRTDSTDNAIYSAKTPFYDHLIATYPHTFLDASAERVGLPEGQMGNSEIGHMTIGAGTIIDTDLVKIDKAISNASFAYNQSFVDLFDHVKSHQSTLHVMGLLSAGGVHSHEEHLFAFLRAAHDARVRDIAVHVFTDGRDTPPQSSGYDIRVLQEILDELGSGFIASISGRFYAMDRDKNYDRQRMAEEALFGETDASLPINTISENPLAYVQKLHAIGEQDEHFKPVVFSDPKTGAPSFIEKNDGVFFYNYRADRAKQLALRLSEHAESKNIRFVTMTDYDPSVKAEVAYPKSRIETTLAAEVSKAGLTQAHIAETEKYAHATFFLNGGRLEPHAQEKNILVESRKDVPTHDLAPNMRAEGIADKAIEELDAGVSFMFINFANADMVGHTANVPAIISSVEELDSQLQRVVTATLAHGGTVCVTADHGNAELNKDPITGEKHTAHTTNLVPCIITIPGMTLRENGTLADVAPTVLSLMGLEIPQAMTGSSLLE